MQLARLLPDDDDPRPPLGAYAGEIAADAEVDEPVPVTLGAFDGGLHLFGPCPWMPRGDVLPTRGDRCLVVFDDDGAPWVIAWEPS